MAATMGRNQSSKTVSFMIILLLGVAIVSTDARGRGRGQGVGGGLRDGDGIGAIPAPGEKVFNVVDFGAKSGGRNDNVQAFMTAFRANCDFPGKSRLVVPPGIFAVSNAVFQGPCKGPGPTVFQISGTIQAVSDISLYPESEWLVFELITGLVIFGGGVVDGQGGKMWPYNDCTKNPDCVRLPASIVIKNVINGSIRRITSLNPMGFHYFVSASKDIRMQRLHMKAPADSPNTDGVHISQCNNLRLSQTHIETGDDCIGILQGSTQLAINKVTCGPGHGISIGSLGKYDDEQDVRGIQVKNCTLIGTTNGLRIKTFPFKQNIPQIRATGFLFQDIVMNNVKNPIIIDQEYCGRGHSCAAQPSRIQLSDIYFINIKGTTMTPEAMSIRCSSAVPCQNVHFTDISITGLKGPSTGTCVNARANFLGVQIPPLRC